MYLSLGPFTFVSRIDDNILTHMGYGIVRSPHNDSVAVSGASLQEYAITILQLLSTVDDKTLDYCKLPWQ